MADNTTFDGTFDLTFTGYDDPAGPVTYKIVSLTSLISTANTISSNVITTVKLESKTELQ